MAGILTPVLSGAEVQAIADAAAVSAAAAAASAADAAASLAKANAVSSVGVANTTVTTTATSTVTPTPLTGSTASSANTLDSMMTILQSTLGLKGYGFDFGISFGGTAQQLVTSTTGGFGRNFGNVFGTVQVTASSATGGQPNALTRGPAQRFFRAQQ